MPIPTSITRAEMSKALKPLYDLLGTSANNIYDSPGVVIAGKSVTFFVPIAHEEDPTGRAPAALGAGARPTPLPPHPQGHEQRLSTIGTDDAVSLSELAYEVVVRVEDGI